MWIVLGTIFSYKHRSYQWGMKIWNEWNNERWGVGAHCRWFIWKWFYPLKCLFSERRKLFNREKRHSKAIWPMLLNQKKGLEPYAMRHDIKRSINFAVFHSCFVYCEMFLDILKTKSLLFVWNNNLRIGDFKTKRCIDASKWILWKR